MRRAPLADLPLDRFLAHTDADVASTSSHSTAQKRPLSPSDIAISPAKRRMIAQGALGSPSLRTRSPLVDSGMHPPSSSLATTSFTRKPDAVARKLDFGASFASGSSAAAGEENVAAEASRVVRTSPRLAARTATARRAARAPTSKTSTPPLSRESTPPTMVQRELPLPLDPSSPHYPGFSVPFDTYVEVPRPRAASSRPPSSRGASKEPDGENKENMRPRRGRKGADGQPAAKEKGAAKDGAVRRRSPRLGAPADVNAVSMDIGA